MRVIRRAGWARLAQNLIPRKDFSREAGIEPLAPLTVPAFPVERRGSAEHFETVARLAAGHLIEALGGPQPVDVRTQNSGYTFGGAATIIMNANRPTGFTGPNETRAVNISGTTTVVALQGAMGGLATLNINGGATLAGSPTVTPGTVSVVNHATVASEARLSPGDNYYDGSAVGTMTFAFGHADGRLVLEEGALFTFDLAAPGASDKIAVTAGGVTLNDQQLGDFTFNTLPGFTSGTYTLIESVATTGSLGAVTTGTVGDKPAELKLVGDDLVLEVKASGTLILVR